RAPCGHRAPSEPPVRPAEIPGRRRSMTPGAPSAGSTLAPPWYRRRTGAAEPAGRHAVLTGIDHLVIVTRDLGRAIAEYRGLGFSVVPGGRHPVGTENADRAPRRRLYGADRLREPRSAAAPSLVGAAPARGRARGLLRGDRRLRRRPARPARRRRGGRPAPGAGAHAPRRLRPPLAVREPAGRTARGRAVSDRRRNAPAGAGPARYRPRQRGHGP